MCALLSIRDQLAAAATSVDEKRYTPETTFDGSSGHIQTGTMKATDPVDYTDLLKQFGYDPDAVQIVGSVRTSRWQQREDGEWLVAYRFNIAPRQTISSLDLELLVKKAKARKPVGGHGHWLVFQASDLQLGKRSRDGSTERIVENYLDTLQRSVEQYRHLKRLGVEGIQICMPGDCIEGNVSQNGKNLWLTQETVTEQTRILRRLMVAAVDAFRPLADQVHLDVVNGNHDEGPAAAEHLPGGWVGHRMRDCSPRRPGTQPRRLRARLGEDPRQMVGVHDRAGGGYGGDDRSRASVAQQNQRYAVVVGTNLHPSTSWCRAHPATRTLPQL